MFTDFDLCRFFIIHIYTKVLISIFFIKKTQQLYLVLSDLISPKTLFSITLCLFCFVCLVASLCRYCFVADSRVDSGPLCLSLHKPISARDATGMLPHDVDGNDETKSAHLYGQQANQPSIVGSKRARQQAQWRTESMEHDFPGRRERSREHFLEAKDEKDNFENPSVEDLRNGYNYVLSIDPSPGVDIPESPMQVPVRYPKSTPYTISSDEEEEPEDLSLSSSQNNQPENLTVSKPYIPLPGLAMKDQNAIKYDSNANAVAVPVAQMSNGQLIAQTQIPIPQNLLFHDPRTVNSMMGPSSVMNMASKSVAQSIPQGSITQTSLANPPPLIQAGQHPPPPLQLVNIRGQPPPMLMSPLVSPSSQVLVPLNSVVSPSNLPTCVTPNATNSDDNQNENSAQRKKRKKMEDTTVFRDPPEQSLPFNGPNKYRFYCDVCDTGFTRRYTFNRHKCKGRVEKHYCQLCDKAYLSKYKLKDHILVKHEGQTVSCPECGKRFSSRSSMEMHKKQQHEGQYSIFCKICGKGFNHTGHYYGHMNKHTNTKPFWCQQCGKRFYGSSYLHNHKQVCRGNNDLNYTCTICDRKFKCELYLKKHMKIHDNTPIIANPNVAKNTDEDLTKAGVRVAEINMDSSNSCMSNGDSYQMSMPIFPNGPDFSDSSSNSGLMIDEPCKGDKEGNNNFEGGNKKMTVA